MSVLQITSNRPGAGQTSLAAALLVRLASVGRKIAYYKPFSATPDDDQDVAFVTEFLVEHLGLPAVSTPSSIPQEPPSEALTRARTQVEQLDQDADMVVVDGPDVSQASGLADALDAKLLLVHGYFPGDSAETVASAASALGDRLAGVVVNSVPAYRREALAVDLAAQNALPSAVLPESRAMLAVSVAQIAAHLDGQWVLDPINTDAAVERFLIGGNLMDSGPNYFGRFANQAVITRTQRPDIQMASFSPGTKCLVLTGAGEPTEYIKAEAFERDIPLIQVRTSTLDTAEALDGLLEGGSPHTLAKVQHFAGLLAQHAAPDSLESWTA